MEGQQLIDLAKVLGESDARRMVLAIKDLGARSNRTTIENVVKEVFEASKKRTHTYLKTSLSVQHTELTLWPSCLGLGLWLRQLLV